ncbi:MAG TPA: ribonuclease H-like domain-containing protein [Patescibacteria group bacterium]|nr:ribonuclease H-like domain-containing protein [Patescibacteria group bacterium]
MSQIKKVVLDLETQKEFAEVGGRGKNHLLKVSVCGIYEYATDKYSIFEENELPRLAGILQSADQIIGFNILDFDFDVLQPYMHFDLKSIPSLDILVEIQNVLGHKISLEKVAQATLGTGKSGNGLQAVLYWRSKRMTELKKYCLDDVKVTKQIYDYLLKNQKLLYQDFFKMKEIPFKIQEPASRFGVLQQAVLF